jgi:hypothetical protein
LNGDGFAQAGESVTYAFTVTNTGNVTLTNVNISDANAVIIGGPIPVLAPGVSNNSTFTGIHVITQSDINAGEFTNLATAVGTDPDGIPTTDQSDDPTNPANVDPDNDGDPDDPTVVMLPQNPAISVSKIAMFNDLNGNGYANAGETISYTFVVTNTGNVTLTNVTITDSLITVIGGPIASMAPGQINSITFFGSYVLTQADIDSGSFTNIATATGTDPNGDPVTDESDDPFNPMNEDPDGDGDPDDPTVLELPMAASLSLKRPVHSMT